jgi:hypothetical protein
LDRAGGDGKLALLPAAAPKPGAINALGLSRVAGG